MTGDKAGDKAVHGWGHTVENSPLSTAGISVPLEAVRNLDNPGETKTFSEQGKQAPIPNPQDLLLLLV